MHKMHIYLFQYILVRAFDIVHTVYMYMNRSMYIHTNVFRHKAFITQWKLEFVTFYVDSLLGVKLKVTSLDDVMGCVTGR